MPDAHIEIKGLDKLATGLTLLGKMDDVKDAIQVGATHIKGKVAKYPPRKHVSIASIGGWASIRQMKWFFAALTKGEIDVPYRRGQSATSEDLGQKWTIRERNRGFGAVIGNNVSYGIYVQHPEHQSEMMAQIGWKTTQQVLDEEKDVLIDEILDGLEIALERCETGL